MEDEGPLLVTFGGEFGLAHEEEFQVSVFDGIADNALGESHEVADNIETGGVRTDFFSLVTRANVLVHDVLSNVIRQLPHVDVAWHFQENRTQNRQV